MSESQLLIENSVAIQLQKLAKLYQNQQASDVMTRTLDKLFNYEAELVREQLHQLQQDLRSFEQLYGLSSEIFYEQFQTGETDDRMDFVEWASLVQMVRHLQVRLDVLVES